MKNISKLNFWKILYYFIIYSVLGFLLETIYAIFTKGMLESRKSFLYGPFCSIYGIAALFMIFLLEKHKQSKIKLFFAGTIIGLTVEYLFSFLGEKIFYIRWWDYSNSLLNINGRICLFYAIAWGLLSIIFIKYIHPKFDKLIDNIKNNYALNMIKLFTLFVICFIVFDCIITTYALNNFITRIANNYQINIKNFSNKIAYNNKITNHFSDEKMIKIYPNISVITEDNKVLYLGSVLKEYKNYYFSFKDTNF